MAEAGIGLKARLALRDKLLEVLHRAALERPDRQDDVDVGFGREPGSVAFEREQMLATVNAMRAEPGLPRLDMATIVTVEWLSAGHNYAENYALRCSELAVGLEKA